MSRFKGFDQEKPPISGHSRVGAAEVIREILLYELYCSDLSTNSGSKKQSKHKLRGRGGSRPPEPRTNKILDCKIIGDVTQRIKLKCRIDTKKELEYYKAGGILNFVLNEIISNAA